MSICPFPIIDNIHAIAIPLPFEAQLISANLYAVGKGPITLIDTGPKFPGALKLIRQQLNSHNLDFDDVERIIVTHGHIDHAGLASQIRQAAGHPVDFFIHAEDSWIVSEENYRADMWSKEGEALMIRAGMPTEAIDKVRQRFSFFKSLCDPVNNVSFVENGDTFTGNGFHLQIIHTPGHTAGSICLYESQQKIIFSGDHIIKHITPNPLVEIEKSRQRNHGYQSLSSFIKSLDKLSRMDVRYVFSGHGEYIDNMQSVIATYKSHHRQRMAMVLKALKGNPRPAYQLIADVFPVVPEADIFLAISEILVHLEMLIDEGKATLVDPGPPALYITV